ncbi:MAG TPA: COQ9 family protein [Sphingorhabdus lacus]|jgi:ubiquinone biosynthesis protein COQ9|nr:COQ9 family protein [Sphingorhabdus lacus]HNW18777.1 COQ9 family protein [Sphingorhabdus lacus]HPV67796.1 COQ9 family protein [Sphingorhabdus lacus]
MMASCAYIFGMTDQKLPTDPTLDEIRAALAPLIARNAAFDGWSYAAVDSAAVELEIEPDVAALAFNGNAMRMVDAWIDSIDQELARRLTASRLNALKIRDRITILLATRLEIMNPDREALRRAMAIMAMPQNIVRGTKVGWRSADRMWRMAGDTASDFNHYTKRATLSAVYGSTISVFVNDESPDFIDTRAFLDRRIENVMQFEKVKAQARARKEYAPSLSRFIGRLRYPA